MTQEDTQSKLNHDKHNAFLMPVISSFEEQLVKQGCW